MNHLFRAAVFGVLGLAATARAADVLNVTPLVTDRTFVVARIDPSQLKIRAAGDWVIALLQKAGLPDDAINQARQGIAGAAMVAQPGVDGLTRAGVGEVALVVNFQDTFQKTPILLVAVAKPADPEAVRRAFAPTGMRDGEKGGLMVFSPNLPRGVLAGMQAADRPELLDAVGALDGSIATAAVAVPDAIKADIANAIAQQNRVAPEEQEAHDLFIQGVQQYKARLSAAAGPSLSVTANTTAPTVADQIVEFLRRDRKDKTVQSMVDLAKSLPPKKDESAVTWELKQADFETVAKAAVPAVMNARASAERVKSMSNMRQLMLACIMYSNENRGAVPNDLTGLGEYLGSKTGVPDAILTNPQRPDLAKQGYVYVPATEGKVQSVKNPSTRLAIYEAGDWKDGKSVAFWDGHVEWVKDKTKFDALLAEAQPDKP
ncbi:MAG: hypothetical protein QM754_01785 [Tepidisphaeraceae bacterium]